MGLVGLILEAIHLDPVLSQITHRPQSRHGIEGEFGGSIEYADDVGELGGDSATLESETNSTAVDLLAQRPWYPIRSESRPTVPCSSSTA